MGPECLSVVLRVSSSTTSAWGAVDHGDQLRGYYSCRTKSRKFYKYIYHFLLDVTITNGFILYKHFHHAPKYKTIKEFRLQLARETIVVVVSLVVTEEPSFHYSFSTSQSQLAATLVQGEAREDDVPIARSTITGVQTPSGFVTSAVCGCVTAVILQLTAFTCGTKIDKINTNNNMQVIKNPALTCYAVCVCVCMCMCMCMCLCILVSSAC